MGKRNRKYRWYVHTVHGDTIGAIACELCARGIIEENAQRDMLCGDGVRRNLWECPIDVVKCLERMPHLNDTFELFIREGRGIPCSARPVLVGIRTRRQEKPSLIRAPQLPLPRKPR